MRTLARRCGSRLAAALLTCAALAACASRPPAASSTWPPPCAGSRIVEITNLGTQTYEVTWGDELLGRATPGVSRLPLASFTIVDARVIGGPLFRVLGSRAPFGSVSDVSYRLLCE